MSEPHDVLIVEDELIVQQAAERILRLEDLTVHKAAEADEAARKLHDHTYCLILSDLMLPGSSGFDIIELARSCCESVCVIERMTEYLSAILASCGINSHILNPGTVVEIGE